MKIIDLLFTIKLVEVLVYFTLKKSGGKFSCMIFEMSYKGSIIIDSINIFFFKISMKKLVLPPFFLFRFYFLRYALFLYASLMIHLIHSISSSLYKDTKILN